MADRFNLLRYRITREKPAICPAYNRNNRSVNLPDIIEARETPLILSFWQCSFQIVALSHVCLPQRRTGALELMLNVVTEASRAPILYGLFLKSLAPRMPPFFPRLRARARAEVSAEEDQKRGQENAK